MTSEPMAVLAADKDQAREVFDAVWKDVVDCLPPAAEVCIPSPPAANDSAAVPRRMCDRDVKRVLMAGRDLRPQGRVLVETSCRLTGGARISWSARPDVGMDSSTSILGTAHRETETDVLRTWKPSEDAGP